MARITIPKDDEVAPGWFGSAPFVRCSNGHLASIADHLIADNGHVSPSLVCPTEGCNFHEFVILEDWLPNVGRELKVFTSCPEEGPKNANEEKS